MLLVALLVADRSADQSLMLLVALLVADRSADQSLMLLVADQLLGRLAYTSTLPMRHLPGALTGGAISD